MANPKLIMLYGFASSGKSTLAKKYTDGHSDSIVIEGDILIEKIEKWRDDKTQARETVFEQTKSLAAEQLKNGHDVILPYLLTNDKHAAVFEKIAQDTSADFLEIYIDIDKEEAISRLLKRGFWGEEGSPKLSEANLPEINQLYDTMKNAMTSRKNTEVISSEFGDIDGTYSELLKSIT